MTMKDLRDLTLSEMEELAVSMGQPRFRARQLFGWIYKGKTDFREMKNLPGVFVTELEKSCTVGGLETVRLQESASDGTKKFLFALADGNAVESVFMKYKYGNSVCISSQAGCRMGCAFCASGIDGLVRNLTAGEMISQVMDVEAGAGEKISHVVVMGTGEPFDNYENLSKFIRLINDHAGFDLGMRNITVSTCGLVPGIGRFAEDFPQANLAISLHGTTDEQRSALMPVNKSYPLAELLSAARDYTERTKRRITFEYALIRGVNDGDDDVARLCHLLRGMLCHVNLIPLNAVTETGFATSGRQRAMEIQKLLADRGIPATVRRQLGSDIDGACGQLRLENLKKEIERI
jgi:23S rRNA (adenine2503-C2)-methyltransferase